MPDVHLPHLDDEDHDGQRDPLVPSPASAPTVVAARSPRRHSPLKLLLEVALITTGVFLGLAGESWRESRHHHELAEQSLRRFRAEFTDNRKQVVRVHDTHVRQQREMRAYISANSPGLLAHMGDPTKPIPAGLPDNTTDAAGFGYAAWDVALATQSLAYIDPELVAQISAVYRVQQMVDEDHRAIQQVSYSFSNYVQWFLGVTTYFGDTVLHEKLLLRKYEEILPALDKAIGGS